MEQQIVLGWLLDTRRLLLLVSLPSDKYSAWTETIAKVIKEKGCTKGDLDSTLEGQLNRVAYVIPLARHFLNRLRTAGNSKSNKKGRIKLTIRPVLADLNLWMELLRWVNAWISMNLIMTQIRANIICWSNSCPLWARRIIFGLGGFWRLRIYTGEQCTLWKRVDQ